MTSSASLWAVITLALVGCVNVPLSDQLIAYRGGQMIRTGDAACSHGWQTLSSGLPPTAALDSADFTLMSWNLFKGRNEHWSEDFMRLSGGQDIVLLQEAHLTPAFRALLERSRYRWTMTRAFDYQGAATGVLTAGRATASGACLSRLTEPLIRTPKSALVTRLPLGASREELWIANLHGINFTDPTCLRHPGAAYAQSHPRGSRRTLTEHSDAELARHRSRCDSRSQGLAAAADLAAP